MKFSAALVRCSLIALALSLGLVPAPTAAAEPALPERPNILFIAIDDLRPEIRAYGNEMIHSPNLDRLAERGLQFNRAYAQQALCAPSRTSLMTGIRPGVRGINATDSQNKDTIREVLAEYVTLPECIVRSSLES